MHQTPSNSVSERLAAGHFSAAVAVTLASAVLLAQLTLVAVAQSAGRPVITAANAAGLEHLAEVEVIDWVGTVAFLPDGSAVISDRGDETFAYWSVDDLAPLGEPIPSGVGWPTSIAVHPDGEVIATAGEGGGIQLWDAATGEARGAPLKHAGGLFNIAFSPDGSQLASFGFNHVLTIWDPATGTELSSVTLEGRGDRSCEVAYAPDGSVLATSGEGGVVHVWDADTLEPVASIEGEGLGWSCAKAFSPDGSILATGRSNSGYFYLWDTGSWELIGEPIVAHPGVNFFALAFSPDGSVVASGGSSGLRLWDVASGEPLGSTFLAPSAGDRMLSSTSSLAFSPDGTLLAVGMGDSNPAGEVHLWGLPVAE